MWNSIVSVPGGYLFINFARLKKVLLGQNNKELLGKK